MCLHYDLLQQFTLIADLVFQPYIFVIDRFQTVLLLEKVSLTGIEPVTFVLQT